MSFSWGDLNPLNWGKDIKNSFMKDLQHALLYLFYIFVNDLIALFSAILGIAMSAVNGFISGLVYSVSDLGPISIPVFIAVVLVIFLGSADLFKLGKNLPVVGDFL